MNVHQSNYQIINNHLPHSDNYHHKKQCSLPFHHSVSLSLFHYTAHKHLSIQLSTSQ